MQEIEIYNAIRQEIVNNITLMNWLTLYVALALLIGCWVVECRSTILSVFLPLLTVVWAAAILRFDYLIHRQGLYLTALESIMVQKGISVPLWEIWKREHTSGIYLIPSTDLIIFLLIVSPTIYMLFAHTQKYFQQRSWRFGRLFCWSVIVLMSFFLALIPFVKTLIS